jgi:hypothetical protein
LCMYICAGHIGMYVDVCPYVDTGTPVS